MIKKYWFSEEFLNKKMNEDKLIAIAINTDNLDLESKQKTDEPTVDPKFFWQKPKKGEGPALNIRILSCFPQENSIKSRENSFKKSEIRHFMEEEDRNKC